MSSDREAAKRSPSAQEQHARQSVWRRLGLRSKGEPMLDSLRAVIASYERDLADAERTIRALAPCLLAAKTMFNEEVARHEQ